MVRVAVNVDIVVTVLVSIIDLVSVILIDSVAVVCGVRVTVKLTVLYSVTKDVTVGTSRIEIKEPRTSPPAPNPTNRLTIIKLITSGESLAMIYHQLVMRIV